MGLWSDITRDWPAYRTARIGCLQKANASCIAAMEDGQAAGIVVCILPATRQRHAVTWVIEDGKQILYDPSYKKHRTVAELGDIRSVTLGPSKGAFDLCPMPQIQDGDEVFVRPN